MKIRLPTLLLALLLLTSPAQASGLGNDKAAHITASAAAGIVLAQNKPFNKGNLGRESCLMSLLSAVAKSGMIHVTLTDIAQIGETLQQTRLAQYRQRA